MTAHTASFEITTKGKGTSEITAFVENIVAASGIRTGIATVFVQHTSASLILFENADHSARVDLEAYFERLVPENSADFIHIAEGSDDSAAHIKTILTRTSETIPIAHGQMQLGSWQGIYLFEHRRHPHHRRVIVSVIGVKAP